MLAIKERPIARAKRSWLEDVMTRWAAGRVLWLCLPLSIVVFAVRWYVVRELLVLWLFFCALFGAGLLVVIAAFLVGEAVESTVLWTGAKVCCYCRQIRSLASAHNWLSALAPADSPSGKRTVR